MKIDTDHDPATANGSKHYRDRRFTAEDITRHAAKLHANHHAVLSASLDMPMKKIGEHLNIPIGTVKSRLHRGRIHLQTLIDRETR